MYEMVDAPINMGRYAQIMSITTSTQTEDLCVFAEQLGSENAIFSFHIPVGLNVETIVDTNAYEGRLVISVTTVAEENTKLCLFGNPNANHDTNIAIELLKDVVVESHSYEVENGFVHYNLVLMGVGEDEEEEVPTTHKTSEMLALEARIKMLEEENARWKSRIEELEKDAKENANRKERCDCYPKWSYSTTELSSDGKKEHDEWVKSRNKKRDDDGFCDMFRSFDDFFRKF